MRNARDLPESHAITLTYEDAEWLNSLLTDWVKGRYFDAEPPEDKIIKWSSPVVQVIDTIASRNDLPVLTESIAGDLGRLLTYIRKEYANNYKEITKTGSLAHLKTSFMDSYREINRIAHQYYQPFAHKRFALETKEMFA